MTSMTDIENEAVEEEVPLSEEDVLHLMVARLCDGLDHPEIWEDLPIFLQHFPGLHQRLDHSQANNTKGRLALDVLRAVAGAVARLGDDPLAARAAIARLAAAHSLSALVQGAVFFIESRIDPDNPKYDLTDRFCPTPFEQIDVLDGSTHLCCASWITQSSGNLGERPWQDVWNSNESMDIRQSIQDGSYRYCNKTACPRIASGTLPKRTDIAARNSFWAEVVEGRLTRMPRGPGRVNLSYDQTCNLYCESCRSHKIASDSAKRESFARMQEEKILPMLKDAQLAIVTGSGDPFASKNFRQLIERMTAEEFPDLRFQVMTNAMLLTEREWANFPALHERTAHLRISIDAATGPTHEKLRRGAKWDVMERNLRFASQLRFTGQVKSLDLSFVVQVDNYREMGDCVDLARWLGADNMDFLRLTNWGTFSSNEYAARAVFLPQHPQHETFLAVMADPRLRDPIVRLSDLADFAPKQ
ncbi:radical SAM protein [Novosphingobium sediminicola]|uniref:Putative Fe-S cluster-containing radical SAM superfamily protein n=1 Tax=Novosphingobium sediminicola TaxID=563162 RepID=A0A7W6G878_9SPHN|nr:radical SAM protein [Novosphingobium sediminicola]MBB3957011.1 putative Fe-S cluster-containing radical SAM superfamily protein [Novosphingobium sediminicola]